MADLEVPQHNAAGATKTYWQKFQVPYQYPVVFGRNLFDPTNATFADIVAYREAEKRHRVFFVIDEGIVGSDPGLPIMIAKYAEARSDCLQLISEPMIVPGGEKIKNELTYLESIQDAIHSHGIDRHSYVTAIGGGAVLDAVGLAASTVHRGVRHIRMPTTVLSQNDSGVGVKNAVNLKGIKNYVGTFAPPWAVINDFEFLAGLSLRDRIAGISEAVKVALIRDGDFFNWLEANVSGLVTFRAEIEERMIERSAQLHMRQIAKGGDPFENGSARPLDFGHWSAHKLEALTNNHVSHGEAVAIGIALDARYSVLKGLLAPGQEERIVVLLENLGLRVWHPSLERKNRNGHLSIIEGLREFQEHLGGDLTITLLKEIGVGVEVNEMDTDLVRQASGWLKRRDCK